MTLNNPPGVTESEGHAKVMPTHEHVAIHPDFKNGVCVLHWTDDGHHPQDAMTFDLRTALSRVAITAAFFLELSGGLIHRFQLQPALPMCQLETQKLIERRNSEK